MTPQLPDAQTYWRSQNPDADAPAPSNPGNPYGLGPGAGGDSSANPYGMGSQSSSGGGNDIPDAQTYYHQQHSDEDASKDQGTKPKPPPPMSVTDFLINQAPHSIINTAQNISSAAVHPIRTGEAMGNLIAGTFKAAARAAGAEMPQNESDQVAKAAWDYLKNRYGDLDAVKNSLYHDPVGVMMDLSTVLSGVGGAVGLGGAAVRGTGALADLAGAAKTAETVGEVGRSVGTVGRGLTTAGEWASPLAGPPKLAGKIYNRLTPTKSVAAFDPRTATFADEVPAFDPSTGEFDTQPRTPFSQPPPPRDPVQDLRAKWGIKNPPSGIEMPQTPGQAPPAITPAAAASSRVSQNIRNFLSAAGGAGLGAEAKDLLVHHLTGAVLGGGLLGGAVVLLPKFLRTSAGQQMLATLGPGSKAATAASVARDLVPALNSAYRIQQQQQPDQLRITPNWDLTGFGRAKGGMVNPELARIQRERLQLPGVLHMLERSK